MTTTRPAGTARPAPAGRTGARQPRLHVDWTACDGRGLCIELLPELYDRDPWGYPLPRRDDGAAPGGAGDQPVPPELAEHAERAVTLCPRLALRLLPPA
jgi:ferredoxin